MEKSYKKPFRKKVANFLQSMAFTVSTGVLGGMGAGAAIYNDAGSWDTVDPALNTQMEQAFESRLTEMSGLRQSFETAQNDYHLTVASGNETEMQKKFKVLEGQEKSIAYQSTELAKGILTANMDEETAEKLASQFIDAGLLEYTEIKLHDDAMYYRNEAIQQEVSDLSDIHDFNSALREMKEAQAQKYFEAPTVGVLAGLGFGVLGMFGMTFAERSRRLDRWSSLSDVPKGQSGLKGLKKSLSPNAPKRN